MTDLFSHLTCTICGKPLTEFGCSAPGDVGAFCRAPVKRRVVQFLIPAGCVRTSCRSCAAPVFWILTNSGKHMPVNPDGITHFATCPNADSHRKPKGDT